MFILRRPCGGVGEEGGVSCWAIWFISGVLVSKIEYGKVEFEGINRSPMVVNLRCHFPNIYFSPTFVYNY